MSDHIKASDFDPPLTGKQVEQVQEVVNEALRRRIAEEKTYPYEEADNVVLGPEIFAAADGSVLSWKGQNYVPQKAVDPHPALKSYKMGEYVEVDRGGNWLPGRISSVQGGMINVDTERGPVTVGGPLRIRKAPKA